MKRIRIKWPKGEVTATLTDTPTAKQLVAALPASSRANTWGEEVYFSLPVSVKKEKDAVDVVPPVASTLAPAGSCPAWVWIGQK